MKLWIVVVWIVVVATWLWWDELVRPAALRRRRQVYTLHRRRRSAARVEPRYQTVTLPPQMPPVPATYTQFIKALRAQLASGDVSHGIPVMLERSKVPDSKRFILVELSNWAADSPVTFAVDVTNAYVVAYRTGSRSFFLPDDDPNPPIVNPFPITERNTFPSSGGYTDLETVARKTRADIALGKKELGDAIEKLRISDLKQRESLAHSLIVVIQMVAEAVRFKHIEKLVCDSFGIYSNPTTLDPIMLKDEKNWGAMSKAIHRNGEASDEAGLFSSRVAIMLFVRRTGTNPYPTVRRMMVKSFKRLNQLTKLSGEPKMATKSSKTTWE